MQDYFGKNADAIGKKKLFLFDMDGTIYEENRLFDGVIELLDGIVKKGGRYVFITNNSSKSVKDYIKKVRKMGIKADEDNFFTSAQATALYLKESHKNDCIYAQGTKSFLKEMKKSGLKITRKYDENAKVVLVGFDPEITGKKLRTTCKMLTKNEVEYIATNPDWVYIVDFGCIPDCGSMCESIARATGKNPVFIGKPQPTMIKKVMQKFGYKEEETLVLGDRLYTDIASGKNANVDTVCVLSGEVKVQDLRESDIQPTYVFESVKDLIAFL